MVIYITIAVIMVVAAIFFYRKKRKKKMPAGLQIFDENGKLTFDLSHSTSRFIGQYDLSNTWRNNPVTKTISVAKNSSSERIFFYLQMLEPDMTLNDGFNGGRAFAIINETNSTINFTCRYGKFRIYYGVYVP